MGIRLGDSVAFPIVESQFVEAQPRLSPDGHWLAYMSFESGRPEIYVRPFPQQGARVQVTSDGGREPMWAPSGKTLFYRHASNIIGLSVTTSPTFSVGGRTLVPDVEYVAASIHQSYDVAPDGKSFLLLRPAGEGTQAIVVLNWARELRTRVAAK
jgi:serine/threonine-protein kinase